MLTKEEVIENLKEQLPPGTKVYTLLNHVSRSGMSRSISLKVIKDGEIRDVTWSAAIVMDMKRDPKNGGIKIGGCGMDMGFALVYRLSKTLYPKGFNCAGEGCEGSYHFNHGPEEEKEHHSDGGYALKQEWI